MRLSYILNPDTDVLTTIRSQCENFLAETDGLPLLKNLPSSYDDFHKVKVRKRKRTGDFVETFNEAFDEEFSELRQRAIFANGEVSLKESTNDEEPFYIFPINGYKYMFCTEVQNSNQQYQSVFESILSTLETTAAEETFRDLLKFSYKSTDIVEGITSGAEIIIYGIPYYYAVRQSMFVEYEDLLSSIQGD